MLALSAVMAAAALQADDTIHKPTLVVQGAGRIEQDPDLADLEFFVTGEGETSDDALRDLVAKTALVDSILRSIDADIRLETESVEVVAVRGDRCFEDRYDERPVLTRGECAIQGHIASQTFSATTDQPLDAGTMVGAVARTGASEPTVQDFRIADRQAATQEALARAFADARREAETIAAAGGFRLGDILAVSTSSRGTGDIVITGSRVSRPKEQPVTVDITPQKVTTNATVTVTYAIEP